MTRRVEMESLGERLAEQGAHLYAALHRFLTDLRRFDEGQGWALQYAQSCAHWLAWRLGMDRATAREHLRISHRLAALPLVDDALRRGAISYSKVRAVTRVAVPATEAALLAMAEHMTASQLELACRKLRTTQQKPADPNEATEQRYVTRHDRDDGLVAVTAVVRADEAARLFGVLDAIAAERTRDASAETPSSPPPEGPTRKIRRHRFDRCDALMELIEGHARGDRPDRAPVELVITVSAAALANDAAVDLIDRGGVTADGGSLAMATVRRLACDAGVVIVAEDAHGNPLSVGRKHRTVTTALKRALAVREPHCQFPGCSNRMFVEAHHIEHWIDGGATELANMTNLCTLHHDMLHAHRFTIERGSPPRFFDEDGHLIVSAPARPQPANLGWPAIRVANANLGISADTNVCRWDGDPIDYDEAIAELCVLEDRGTE